MRDLPLVTRPEPIHDATAREVVGGELDPHTVAGVHPDPEPAHLSGGVAERLVPVVEVDAEHAVPERLDDLAGHLDLLFFVRDLILLDERQSGGGRAPAACNYAPSGRTFAACGPFSPSWASYSTFAPSSSDL